METYIQQNLNPNQTQKFKIQDDQTGIFCQTKRVETLSYKRNFALYHFHCNTQLNFRPG